VSHALVNGRGAFWGELRIPRIGAWEADFGVSRDGAEELTGTAAIEIGGRAWKGRVWRSGENVGVIYLRIVGGAGGLSRVVPAKSYQGVPLSLPVSDLLAEVGETLSPASDMPLLASVVTQWTRTEGTAGACLRSILAQAAGVWRVLADGTVWIGRETWPESALTEYTYCQQVPNAGAIEVFAAEPAIYPGEVFRGRRVSVVAHRIEAQTVRTRILWEEDQEVDRLKSGLLAVIRSAFPQIDYLAGYGCRVVAQNADGSLELVPDDPRIPGLSNVPIRYGVPGVKATVSPGARVLLEFSGGNPAAPFATAWESASVTKLQIDATTVEVNGTAVKVTASSVQILGGIIPVAKEGSPLQGAAGPYALAGTVAVGGGSPDVKVP
jgi:hypothetical protein